MDLSHLAKDMQMLSENMADSFDARVSFITDNVKDVHSMINGFSQSRRKNTKQMMNNLHEFHGELQENTAKLMKGLQSQIKQIRSHVQEIRESTQTMMADNQKHLHNMHNSFVSGCKAMVRKRAAFAHAHG